MKDQIKVHLDVYISETDWNEFKEVSNQSHLQIPEALRKALILWTLIKEKEKEEQNLALVDKNKKIKVLIKNP